MPEIELIPPELQKVRVKKERPTLKLADTVPKEHKPKKEVKVPRLRVSEKYKESLYIPPEREIRPGVPVIPFNNPCCEKLCGVLNNEIDDKKGFLESTVAIGGGRALYESGAYRTTKYKIDALELHRQDLKDNGSCRCMEETAAVSIMLPLIQAKPIKKETEEYVPKGPPILTGLKTESLRSIHREEKPTIPTENECCTKSCEILNEDIDKNNHMLDDMEIRGGPKIRTNPRYEALVHRTLALQDYRVEQIKKGSCKCTE